ncbi:MAG: SbcC/MukB-like Walker B domain-containing protein [Deltaproteobacteria bacterium]|nr:SbcC/MukB-like Walker B domain-containing protein [Deltaproteobacteria bacterium]
MNNPFHVQRIRLINFHNFVDETLPVRKNLFLVGDNQSGKTTVLDAVHFALSAGVDMEFNAAARFGPRTEAGRNLASIVLRYDLERDVAQRGPSVMYAVLEIGDGSGASHTFGAGAFVTSLDAQPDVWGFVARGRTIEEVGLCTEEMDSKGAVRHRPLDRQELEERLGRGAVLDKGRYRTALAQLLFKDRDAYARGLELITAGKAYREMVARARNLDDLFVGLLPPPAESEFEEVRSALRAIEGIGSDLADLDAELGVLRLVIDKLQETRRETEKIARYEFVGAEFARRRAAGIYEDVRGKAEKAREDAEQAEKAREAAANNVASCDAALRALRASEGAALLAREEEVHRDVAEEKAELARARTDLVSREAERDRAYKDASEAEGRLDRDKADAVEALRVISETARDYLDEQTVLAVGHLVDVIGALEPEAVPSSGEIEKPLSALRGGFGVARDQAAERAAVAEREVRRLQAEAEAASSKADEVRRRAEVLPDLPDYGELLSELAIHADRAVPLYRLFALGSEVTELLGSGIECMVGPRVLGAIVVPPEQHAEARARVIAHAGGVEVVDPSEFAGGDVARPVSGSLPGVLIDAEDSALAQVARTYLERVAGDVRILVAGESRADAERAVWADGLMYEHGANSRVEPAAPRFLGAEARARAAAEEETRLRAQADQLLADAKRAEGEASALRTTASACRQALGLLGACGAGVLLGAAAAVERARGRAKECEAAKHETDERVTRATDRLSRLQSRLGEIQAAVASAGVSDLRNRIGRTEAELERAQKEERRAIGDASRARTASEERTSDEQAAAEALQASSGEAKRRSDVLLPLVEPRYRADLDDYVFRTMRGNQIRAENVADLIGEADRMRARAFQWLDSSDGIRNERLWQKYAFRVNEVDREIRDQASRPVEEVYEQRETEVRSLQTALDDQTRDLLERVVMAGLVRRFQGQVRELRDTIQGINRLASDLRFGTSRFQFSLRQRPEFQRLLDLLREQSVLQPALREELRDFFQARLDELRHTREGEVPEILDYRRWFEYVLQVQSRVDGTAQDLPRQRLRFGSTGEQAVPTYLLVLAVASLLYDRTDARLRLLLLDEAFLGIDAGRREVLMQFADRAGVNLIVATPELDGMTPALAASSTLFIEKTAEQDIFVSDYHWERPAAQASLFERQAEPDEADLVLGVTRAKDVTLEAKPQAPEADSVSGKERR